MQLVLAFEIKVNIELSFQTVVIAHHRFIFLTSTELTVSRGQIIIADIQIEIFEMVYIILLYLLLPDL